MSDNHVYYAKYGSGFISADQDIYIGIFSTTELACHACVEDHQERFGKPMPDAKWIAMGDSIRHNTTNDSITNDEYWITALELDRRIEYASHTR